MMAFELFLFFCVINAWNHFFFSVQFSKVIFLEAGNRELGGAHDLVSQYKLWPFYEFFCKKSLPLSISETHYLRNVVGDTKIKKGEGMELDQLCKNTYTSEKKPCLFPFDLNVLSEAFHMREMDPNSVSSVRFFKLLLSGCTFEHFFNLHTKESEQFILSSCLKCY